MVSIMGFLLDSVILIDHFNGLSSATAFIRKQQRRRLCISVVTRAEVLVGFKKQDEKAMALELLDLFETLAINQEIADEAAMLRQHYNWKLPDAFQAAIAKHHSLKLVTRNTKDFDPDKHRFVITPYLV